MLRNFGLIFAMSMSMTPALAQTFDLAVPGPGAVDCAADP